MKLASFGCSFLFGSDLSDMVDCPDKDRHSNLTWPAIVSRNLGIDYKCFARPGSGNLQIWLSLINQIQDPDPCIHVIKWSFIDRYDFLSADISDWHDNRLSWRTLHPTDRDETATIYYRDMHSQLQNQISSVMIVQSAIQLLDEMNQPYVMMTVDDLLIDSRFMPFVGIQQLQDKVDSTLIKFEGKNFIDWCRYHGYTMLNGHPLDTAHAAAADLMQPVIASILHRA